MTFWPCQTTGNPICPPLLFLHGFMGCGADWLPIAKRLAGQFYCLMPDLPGHGHNINLSFSAPLNFDGVVDGLIQWLDQYGLERVNLAGYSMGGRIALYAATKFPQRIVALILESANPGLAAGPERQARAELDDERAQTLLQIGIEAFVDRWYEMGLFSSLKQYPHLLEQTKAARKQSDPRWAAKVISELSPGRQPPLWDYLDALTMPVFLMAGELDVKYVELTKKMARHIPNAAIEIIPNAGHNIHLEQPDAFAGAVRSQLTILY